MNEKEKEGLCSDILRFMLLDITKKDIVEYLTDIKSNLSDIEIIDLTNRIKIKLENIISGIYYEDQE